MIFDMIVRSILLYTCVNERLWLDRCVSDAPTGSVLLMSMLAFQQESTGLFWDRPNILIALDQLPNNSTSIMATTMLVGRSYAQNRPIRKSSQLEPRSWR